MQHPEHLISNSRKRLTTERIAGLAFGGLIPAVFIWALIAGLFPPVDKILYTPFYVDPIKQPPVQRGQPPATPTFHGPSVFTPSPPLWTTDNGDSNAIHGQSGNGSVFQPGDTGAVGITSTHTTPPYPSNDARLGRQGTVTLGLSIDASGLVTDAQVLASSGSDTLDEAAIAWVKSHWRYQPATHDGVAVATTTKAAIRFDLKNAMR